jgi:hypothetical protein
MAEQGTPTEVAEELERAAFRAFDAAIRRWRRRVVLSWRTPDFPGRSLFRVDIALERLQAELTRIEDGR